MSTDTQNNAPMKVEQVNWPAVEARISEFVGEYEMVGEDEQGRDGRYTPNESERALILDAMHGALADAELMALLRPAAPVADQSDLTQQTLDDVMAGIPARDAEIAALRKEIETQRAQQPVSGADGLPIELQGVSETAAEGGGMWRSCSGCHELNEGHDTGPRSKVFGCALGNGCSECGGIGAIWDTTDYGAMGDALAASIAQPQPSGNSGELPATQTQGMTLGQRIAHVGGRENAQGYVEFGSPMAVHALIQHVLRDFHRQGRVNIAPAQQDATLHAEVLDMVRMLEANEWADHCGQSELGKRLELAITALQNQSQNIPEIIPESAKLDADKVQADLLNSLVEIVDAVIASDEEGLIEHSETIIKARAAIDAARKEAAHG